MSGYKINGQVVSESEWKLFMDSITREIPSSAAYFDDNQVTKDEIVKALDVDGDQKLTFNDFDGMGATWFDNLNTILKKHGFSMGTESGNHISQYESKIDFASVPKYLWKDRDFVLAAVKQNGLALRFAKSLKKDRKIVLAAVKQNGSALRFADELLKKDRKIVLAAVEQNSWAILFADQSLTNDPIFIYEAACISIGVLNHLPTGGREKEIAWSNILRRYNNFSEVNIPDNSLASFESFKSYLKQKYDIEFLDRFRSIDVLIEVLKVRNNPVDPTDERPTALIILPKTDPFGAFSAYPIVGRFIELGYRVIYYEAGDEIQADRYLSEATDGGRKKGDVLWASGDGTAKALSLGGGVLEITMDDEKKYIDTSDFRNGRLDIDFSKYISPDGDIVLDSCLNGEGRADNPNNLANTIATFLPEGVTIHTADRPIKLRYIGRGTNGKIIVKWDKNSSYLLKGKVNTGK